MLWSTFSLAQNSSLAAHRFLDDLFNPSLYDQLQWRNIGPFRGGRSVAAAGVPGQPLVYYMGGTGGGVWKTEDAGQTWFNISDGYFGAGSIGAIAVAETDPNIIYAGTGEHTVRGFMTSAGDGMYKSLDGGQTWDHLGLSRSQHIAAIRLHPQDPETVFVAVQGALYGASENRGVYKSIDGGQTWRKVLYVNETTGAADLSIDWNNPRILYAAMWDHQRRPWSIRSGGAGSAIYKSIDGGENWTKLNGGLPRQMGKVGVAVSRANSNIVYANVETEEGGVFRSDDGGKTWRQTSSDRQTVTRAWYYTKIVVDPVDPETVYVLNEPLLRSIDGGQTFQRIAVAHSDQHCLWIDPQQPRRMILANDGGACVTFNGGKSWSTQDNQPTGQFYRVIADQQFPYRVYGGQQDNTTISIASRTAGPGIGEQDWYPVAGCESGFIAFDPDRPERIYGGCYQGIISVYDQATRLEKNIMAYPEIGLGAEPKDLRYRFNWNAPIVASPHDPRVIYHAANVVLRTRDEGMHWEQISPDLTRNDTTKQQLGGGPFTNEGAGGEVYNTISYLSCSPHDPGVLWAGTDDGLVRLTRNEGKDWTDVTPPDLGEALVNSIEVSPHRPGGAYVVATRYKFNDRRPLIFRTDDYGETWTLITRGIPAPHFVRVVREDPVRPGLLYAGTEYGLCLSYDDGKKWHAFALNLPVCPITDLVIRDNDLIAATSGRGFWILDDLSALQHSLGRLPADRAQLYPPKTAVRFVTAAGGERPASMGQNPLSGAIIDYYLPESYDGARLELQILDDQGRLVRTYTNQTDPDFQDYEGGPDLPQVLADQPGVHRFNWDLRRASVPGIPDVFVFGDYRGGMVAPGQYTVRLLTPRDTLEQTVRVAPDPRLQASAGAFAQQEAVLREIEGTVAGIHQSINRMRSVKKQIENLNEAVRPLRDASALVSKGEAVCQAITDWEAALIQPLQKTAQDVINFPNRLSSELLILHAQVDTHDPQVTAGARRRLDDLQAEWRRRLDRMEEIIKIDVAQYNQLFREKQIPAVITPGMPAEKP